MNTRYYRTRDEAIADNAQIVDEIAEKYRHHDIPFPKLVDIGNAVLSRAIEGDEQNGYQLNAHAGWWIRQAITREIAGHGLLSGIPDHAQDTIKKLLAISKKLHDETGREATISELSREIEIPEDKIERLIHLFEQPSRDNQA